jgi:non-canonical purine NTP pyrophosphatase (RdgB/HAM1 family)
MKQLLYVTGNEVKVRQADTICRPQGIELIPTKLEVTEIQAEEAEMIARDKAEKAYTQLQQPLIVSDDSWLIPGLKGFPGPYMHYINEWFELDDWLNLTKDLQDRRIILRQIVVYQDAAEQKLFSMDLDGILLREARGNALYNHTAIISFDGGKSSNAEYHERNQSATKDLKNVWHEFSDWFKDA